MTDEVVLEFSVLNIFSDPHPKGIYPKILKRIAHKPVHIWGEDYVAITPPELEENGLWTGRIYIWTELDPNAPTIDTAKLLEIPLSKSKVSVPDNIGLNGRIFTYVLREKDHLVFFESRNELGKRLSPYRLVKPLDRLLLQINARGQLHIEISVMPEEDALDKILALKQISTLEIHIKKPNPDDNDEDADAILKELEEQGARMQEIRLTAKSRKQGIKPNKRTRTQAIVAAETGHVAATGRDGSGERVTLSTHEYPKTISATIAALGSAFAVAMRVARNTIIRS